MAVEPEAEKVCIREVWADNLEDEIKFIRAIVDEFPYVAMDTEFPGQVVQPVSLPSSPDYQYQNLRANVNLLKLIQLGLTFCDESGFLPRCRTGHKYCVWQFNFRDFKLRDDLYNHGSIKLLKQSRIDFSKNEERGIDSMQFAELLMSSGVVLNDNMQWITFHSAHDFGYLLKILTCKKLPEMEADFRTLLGVFFPHLYDVKYLMRFCNSLYGGLSRLAEVLKLKRIGTGHQAGSDSLLTSCCFRKLKYDYFEGDIEKYAGVVCGIGV